jgi:HAD superfamily hydrolase (TIGR01509 family)
MENRGETVPLHPLDASALSDLLRTVFGGNPAGVIFDCDGVLIDSGPGNIRFYNLLRQGVGLPPINREQERYVHMSTTQQAIQAIIPAPLMPAVRHVLARIDYEHSILPMLEAPDGLHDFLNACRARDILLAVHTNRSGNMDLVLNQCGLAGYFSPVITAAAALPKPSPEGVRLILTDWNKAAADVLFLGDSTTDRDAAAAAGVPFLAFRTPGLSSLGTCESFHDLRKAVETVAASGTGRQGERIHR